MIIFLLIAIFLLIFILVIRAIRFKPLEEKTYEEFDVDLNTDEIVDRFADMIRCKTISYKDTSLEDSKEFEKFRELLIKRYPNVNANCKLYNIGKTGVLYLCRSRCN